ncbi:DUF6438 domain-containing protein [Flavobacteriales bacterium]|nr:DUF6438 domain-containing protein [Flavobacteriales bacterium]
MRSLSVLFIFLIISCNTVSKSTKDELNQLTISLEKTACFGTCPVFKIKIFKNGKGIFEGKKFVKKKGLIDFKLSQKEIQKILVKAENIKFPEMLDEYSEKITDLPTTYIQIKEKKIKDYFGAPKKLKDLETLIEEIVLNKLNLNSF